MPRIRDLPQPTAVYPHSVRDRRQSQPGGSRRISTVNRGIVLQPAPNQRGLNDYTPLHMSVSERNLPAIVLFLKGGADPRLRTRIDDCETPGEMAEKAGLRNIVELVAAQEARLGG